MSSLWFASSGRVSVRYFLAAGAFRQIRYLFEFHLWYRSALLKALYVGVCGCYFITL